MAEPRRSPLPSVLVAGARFLVVEARFYDDIAAMLREGAVRAFAEAGATVEVVSMPGALELPIALRIALAQRDYAGAVALGCVIRGETYHFELVCNESARALTQIAVDASLPFGNGVLTVETSDQAVVRADPQQGDKGGDAARAALDLWRLKQRGPA